MPPGTGNPYFSTDTAAVLRAIQIKADVIIKATSVDGVYSADPKKDPTRKLYDEISYRDVMLEELEVMDQTAITLCKENELPLIVLNIHRPGAIAARCAANASAPSSDEHDSTDPEGRARVDGERHRRRRSASSLDPLRQGVARPCSTPSASRCTDTQMHAEPGGDASRRPSRVC